MTFHCRAGCGACCIAPSISSPIPGMPEGKPAGVRCIQLDEHNQCRLFGLPERPQVCRAFQAEQALCGDNREQALQRLHWLETVSLEASPAAEMKTPR
ncbi:MAG: YkgJ family cysteine cluster protein [Halomonadaceae bacterium]|nr:MAG: YkgJ family cysteine cluster protein [Halomonadaceae bacterium]